MIAGLPLASWILIAASVSLGLALELRYYRSYRRSLARGRTVGRGRTDTSSSDRG